MLEQSKDKYREILVKELVNYYNMTIENAKEAVQRSSVAVMLKDDEDAKWQMHQPLESTVEEIFCEYKESAVN